MLKFLLIFGVVGGVAFALGSPTKADQTNWEDVPWASNAPQSVILNLVTDRRTITAGADIKLRVTLHALTKVKSMGVGTVSQLAVSITDSNGHVVPMNIDQAGRGTFMGHRLILDPGKTLVMTLDQGGFEPLSDWGYRLTVPGNYTIVARFKHGQVMSNPVTVTVTN